jgi:FkbM family methyltransferase
MVYNSFVKAITMTIRKYTYYAGSIPRLLWGLQPWSRVLAIFLGQAGPGPYQIRLRKSGLSFMTRSAMDIWSIKETFLDRFYEHYGIPIQPNWTIVDIGGGLGDYTLFAATQQPGCQVYAFEPTPDSFALLQQNVAANQVHNVQSYPLAVWSKKGEIAIDTSAGEAVQFTSQEANANQRPGQVIVPSLTLAEALDQCGIQRCNLLKLDCEGAEYPILFSTPPETLARIERIVMEYHDNAGPNTHRDLEKYLTNQGYIVKVHPSPVHAYLGYLSAVRSNV